MGAAVFPLAGRERSNKAPDVVLSLRTALLFVLCLGGVLIVPGTLRAEWVSRQQGLQATLQEAVTAFEQADYARADEGFSYLSQTYGEEEAYRELEHQLLPVWAHACRMNGDPTHAAELYESFLEKYPDDTAQAPFVLFGLAQACQSLGDNARAADAYRRYRERFPERPEALLSVLREADLAFSDGQTGKGIEELLAFAASPRVPATLRAQARLRAVQAAQAAGDDRRAADILLEKPWAVTTMPELAVLAFAGLRAGNYLAAEGRYADAVLAYRNVPPRHLLIDLQRQRLAQLEQIRRERTRLNPDGIQNAAFWEEYFGGIIEKVRTELDELGAMEDYTPAWQLRLGEAFLRGGRSREAGLLYGELAADTSLADDHSHPGPLPLDSLRPGTRGLAARARAGQQFSQKLPERPARPRHALSHRQRPSERRRVRPGHRRARPAHRCLPHSPAAAALAL